MPGPPAPAPALRPASTAGRPRVGARRARRRRPQPRPASSIKSPMVGTFYASSSPDAPPFVTVGSVVRADTTVCIIEAMKVFTEIPAERRRAPSPRSSSRTASRSSSASRCSASTQPDHATRARVRGRRSVGSFRLRIRSRGEFADVPAHPGRQPRRDRPADHPRLPRPGHRGRRRLLSRPTATPRTWSWPTRPSASARPPAPRAT